MAGNKTTVHAATLLELQFENSNAAGIGDGTGLRGSSTAGNFYMSLFTADPTDAGLVTSEATYTGYARKSVSRNSTNWNVTSQTITNLLDITFAACTGSTNDITHWAICKAGTASVQDLLYHGDLDTLLTVDNGVIPELAAGVIDIKET